MRVNPRPMGPFLGPSQTAIRRAHHPAPDCLGNPLPFSSASARMFVRGDGTLYMDAPAHPNPPHKAVQSSSATPAVLLDFRP